SELTAVELFGEIERDIPFYDTSGGGVTFSGGEPLAQLEFLIEMLRLCGRAHIHRAIDTTGYASLDTLKSVAKHTNLFLFDLKIMDPDKHEKYTGVSNHLILDNLRFLAEKEIDLIIRLPLIPGINDDVENLDRTGSFLKQLPGAINVHILPYHDFQKSKFARFKMQDSSGDITRPNQDMIINTKKHLENFGLEVAIGG
ncbi:MAG: glycyl-radical enzyme activating protein, partial [Desulfobacterales bacterium]|nr:glycyl-radical enzyme activating protein [Desulfobacterales bacterium]